MTQRPLIALTAACGLLGACGSDPEPARPDQSASDAQSDAAPADPAMQPTTGDTGSASADGRYSSAYTDIDLSACELVESEQEEGSWSVHRCDGFGGVPYWIAEGDLRVDVDAGLRSEDFQTLGAFNDVGARLEWRIDNQNEGQPFAIIFRYRDVTQEGDGRTVLAVESIGREGTAGCRVAQIAGDVPRANVRAREIADEAAQGFDCSQPPQIVGNAR
jgi:hypothetical protein